MDDNARTGLCRQQISEELATQTDPPHTGLPPHCLAFDVAPPELEEASSSPLKGYPALSPAKAFSLPVLVCACLYGTSTGLLVTDTDICGRLLVNLWYYLLQTAQELATLWLIQVALGGASMKVMLVSSMCVGASNILLPLFLPIEGNMCWKNHHIYGDWVDWLKIAGHWSLLFVPLCFGCRRAWLLLGCAFVLPISFYLAVVSPTLLDTLLARQPVFIAGNFWLLTCVVLEDVSLRVILQLWRRSHGDGWEFIPSTLVAITISSVEAMRIAGFFIAMESHRNISKHRLSEGMLEVLESIVFKFLFDVASRTQFVQGMWSAMFKREHFRPNAEVDLTLRLQFWYRFPAHSCIVLLPMVVLCHAGRLDTTGCYTAAGIVFIHFIAAGLTDVAVVACQRCMLSEDATSSMMKTFRKLQAPGAHVAPSFGQKPCVQQPKAALLSASQEQPKGWPWTHAEEIVGFLICTVVYDIVAGPMLELTDRFPIL